MSIIYDIIIKARSILKHIVVHLPAKLAFSKDLSIFAPIAVAGVALASIVGLQLYAPGGLNISGVQSKPSERISTSAAQQAQQQELARLKLLKTLPTLGYNNLLADWVFLGFLQYFGDDPAREKTDYELLNHYFDVIVTHDPLWVEMYNFLSTSVSFYQARPDLTVKLIERGLKSLSPEKNPSSWLVWRIKGVDELLLLGDTQASVNSHQMAAKWAENTPDHAFAPRLREFAEQLSQDPDNKFIRIQSWLMVYWATEDKLVRKRAIQELMELGVKIKTQENGELEFIIPPEFLKQQTKKK
ncbi:hypothetical protein [Planktothrix mougeotii]|uniref:hypothetical protein n=1 Tax=Planktothrix mougeotii TaxID=54306 RepID=UPI001D148D9B|nr:hypothetical protein [Planktothrix mougeotii]